MNPFNQFKFSYASVAKSCFCRFWDELKAKTPLVAFGRISYEGVPEYEGLGLALAKGEAILFLASAFSRIFSEGISYFRISILPGNRDCTV
jgi:hypothetical protein